LIAVALLPTSLLLLGAELAARFYTYYGSRDPRVFFAPFTITVAEPPAAYPARAQRTYQTRYDVCSGRDLVFTVNDAGGRGQAWTAARPTATLRILAVGESSTFGVNSPDWATWPAFLEATLRRQQRRAVEVLNGGQAAADLAAILERLEEWLPLYAPDVVIYYGAYNDANRPGDRIARFRSEWLIGRVTSWLYNRSILYTSVVEKVQAATQYRGENALAPAIEGYQSALAALLDLVTRHGATPVLVLQATRSPAERRLDTLPLTERGTVHQAIRELADRDPGMPSRERFARIRAYRAQTLVAVVRRVGMAKGILVIDPRPVLERGGEGLFCDEIHLADAGNLALADAIARALVLPSDRGSPVAGGQSREAPPAGR
jgi:lysophospholipase L1-like esterase